MAEHMSTRKKQLTEALQKGDTPEMLTCFFMDEHGQPWSTDESSPVIGPCGFDDLPDREFDSSWGGTEGPPTIAFSERFVYICVQYDGSEWMTAIPRNPDQATFIPWPGGS